MTKIVLMMAASTAATLAGPARAHADAAKKTAAETLAEAQHAHHRATEDHATATANEATAKTTLDAAEKAHSDAEGDAKTAAKPALDKAKADHTAAAKQAKASKTALDKAAKAVDTADKRATKEGEKQAEQEAKAAKKAEAEKAKADAKAAKEEAKKSSQQPEQNDVRRPKADGMCGKAWAIFDEVSKANGSPASIGESLPKAQALGINEATVRTQYARWRKFHGVTGRVEAPKPAEPAQAAA